MHPSLRSVHPGTSPRIRPFTIINDYYAQIEYLADKKSVWARRAIDFIPRARTRPDHDLPRVKIPTSLRLQQPPPYLSHALASP